MFLIHNVHETAPVLFRTRWAMSYLRGPLTRDQIRSLTDPKRGDMRTTAAAATDAAAPGAPIETSPAPAPAADRPMVSPDVREVFLPVDRYVDSLAYRPALLGLATVHFTNRKRTREASEEVVAVVPDETSAPRVDWSAARELALDPARLAEEPAGEASYGSFDGAAPSVRDLKSHAKSFSEHLYRNRTYELFESALVGETSHPGESERDFRIRLAELAREQRDEKVEALRERYAKRIESLRRKVAAAAERVDREKAQASSSKLDTAISMGTTILSAFLGRKRLSSTTLSKAGSAARGFQRSSKEAGDVRRAEAALATWEDKLAELETELEVEIDELEDRYDPLREELEVVELRPRRTDVDVQLVTLAWLPCKSADGDPPGWLTRGMEA